jgi:geranylgeranyl pyrophosphate synthase
MLKTQTPFGVIGEELARFEASWLETLTADSPLIQEVSTYLQKMRGKRFRPALTFLAAGTSTDPVIQRRVLTSALVVEMLHTASLIHDDIIDHSLLRRGMGTINARWNRKTAVLMGDYLFARAFTTLVHETMPDVVEIMADVTLELSEGELLQEQVIFQPDLDESSYFRLIELKTSALIGAACEIGGVVSGVGEGERARLREFGRGLGLVYQIVDDVLDVSGSEDCLGKPVHADLEQGKVTLPLICAQRCATEDERIRIRDLFALGLRRREPADGCPLPDFDSLPSVSWEEVEALVERYDGVGRARARVEELANDARETLHAGVSPAIVARLEPVLDFVLARDH